MKKAAIDVQMNWVFILIAGTVILTFFIAAAQWVRKSGDESLAIDVVGKVDLILASSQVSASTSSQFNIPDTTLIFTCDECSNTFCSSEFRFEDHSPARRETKTDVIFAPDRVESDTLIPWSLEWRAPYKITNFLYITTPEIRYYLVYDEDQESNELFAREIFALLKQNDKMRVSLVSETEVQNINYKNEDQVRFVFFKNNPEYTLDNSLIREEVSAVFFTGTLDSGVVRYSETVADHGEFILSPDTTPYLKKESLIGAIFSGSLQMFECNMQKAAIRLRLVSLLLQERTRSFQTFYQSDSVCSFYYTNNLLDAFAEMATAGEQFKETMQPRGALREPFDNARREIDRANDLVIQFSSELTGKGCPRIY